MPLVEQQVEHLVRPIRSKLSPKEKKVLTSKVYTDAAQFHHIFDGSNLVSDTLGVSGLTGVAR